MNQVKTELPTITGSIFPKALNMNTWWQQTQKQTQDPTWRQQTQKQTQDPTWRKQNLRSQNVASRCALLNRPRNRPKTQPGGNRPRNRPKTQPGGNRTFVVRTLPPDVLSWMKFANGLIL